jgi:hypothetical protein
LTIEDDGSRISPAFFRGSSPELTQSKDNTNMHSCYAALALCGTIALAACTGGGQTPQTEAAATLPEQQERPEIVKVRADRVLYRVRPSDVSPGIVTHNQPSVVEFNRSALRDGQPLVVFLPGTREVPKDIPLMRMLANLGYRAIDLNFDNDLAINEACPMDPNPDCAEEMRRNITYGDAASRHVDTPANETIVARLAGLLAYLDEHYPKER